MIQLNLFGYHSVDENFCNMWDERPTVTEWVPDFNQNQEYSFTSNYLMRLDGGDIIYPLRIVSKRSSGFIDLYFNRRRMGIADSKSEDCIIREGLEKCHMLVLPDDLINDIMYKIDTMNNLKRSVYLNSPMSYRTPDYFDMECPL